jgi:hypothetical protein
MSHLAILAMVCHALDAQTHALRLYELLVPYADRNVLTARLPLVCMGSASHHLGLLALAMSRWEDAALHFEAAIQAHARMDAQPLLARSRYHYAQALLARGRPGDRLRAREQLDQTRVAAERLGMRQLVARTSDVAGSGGP